MNAVSDHRVLIIAYYYPPIKSIGVMRTYQLSHQLARRMKAVVLLTTSNRNHLPQEYLPLPKIQIEELATLDYRRLFSLVSGKKTHLSAKSKPKWYSRLWLLLKESFPTNLFLDEGGLLYLIHGFFKGRSIIRSHNISLIYSSFRPYADHLIAWSLKGRFPEKVWIADFRDLQIDSNRSNVYWLRLQQWFNRRILSRADLVITVSDGLARQLKKFHPKVITIRNGVELRNNEQLLSTSHFNIAYTGSVYSGYQSPELLLAVLSELIGEGSIDRKELRFVYAGKDSAIWKEWINNYKLETLFEDRGLVTHAKALEIQESAHLNLLLSWAGPQLKGILTGKLYEYLGAQRPIVLIIKGDRDPEFEYLFEQLGAGKVYYESQNQKALLKDYLLKLYAEWKSSGKVNTRIKREELQRMNWESRLEEILEQIP